VAGKREVRGDRPVSNCCQPPPPLPWRCCSCSGTGVLIVLVLAAALIFQIKLYNHPTEFCSRELGYFDFSCPFGSYCGSGGICRALFTPIFDYLRGVP